MPGKRRHTIDDYPGLVERYQAGATVEELAAHYRAGHRPLSRLLKEAGVFRGNTARPGRISEGQLASESWHGYLRRAGRNGRQVRFRLKPETAKLLIEQANAVGRTPEELLTEALALWMRQRE